MQNDTGPPKKDLTLGAIRRTVKVAFEEKANWPAGIANLDTEIDCDFQSFLECVSQQLDRKIVIVGTPPSGRFTIGELAEYIADHIEPLPENPDQQTP